MMRPFTKALSALLSLVLAECGSPSDPPDSDTGRPPPPAMPEDAESVDFEAGDIAPDTARETSGRDSSAWGIDAEGSIPIQWEDLMPEGAEEELIRQQDEFFEMLEQCYAASATTLRDAQPLDQIDEGSAMDYMPQFGNFDTVEELEGKSVRIPGYVVPFDFDLDRRQAEFLFVPYMGACIHTPPPPPNQIIFVRADPGERIPDIWAPYWVEGILKGEPIENDVGDAAYSLTLEHMEPYL